MRYREKLFILIVLYFLVDFWLSRSLFAFYLALLPGKFSGGLLQHYGMCIVFLLFVFCNNLDFFLVTYVIINMLSSLIVAFLEKDIVLHFSSSPRASLFFFFFFKSFFSFFLFFLFSHIHKLFLYILLKLFLVVSFSVFSVIFSFFFFSISCRFILFCFVYLSPAHS